MASHVTPTLWAIHLGHGIGAARHHLLLIVNPAQGIPPIVSKIMFAFWCLTVELCSSHVFRFFSVTGGLGAWALFSFFRSFSSFFFLTSMSFDFPWGESSVTAGLQINLQECFIPRTAPPLQPRKCSQKRCSKS